MKVLCRVLPELFKLEKFDDNIPLVRREGPTRDPQLIQQLREDVKKTFL